MARDLSKPKPPQAAAPRTRIELVKDHAELKAGAGLAVVPNDQPYGDGEVTERIAQKLVGAGIAAWVAAPAPEERAA